MKKESLKTLVALVKNYNKLTEDINSYLKLGKDAPEHLFEEKRKYLQMICGVGKND